MMNKGLEYIGRQRWLFNASADEMEVTSILNLLKRRTKNEGYTNPGQGHGSGYELAPNTT